MNQYVTMGLLAILWNGAVPSYSAPIPLRIVDMTHVFDETTLYWPTNNAFQLKMKFNGTKDNTFWLQSEDMSSSIHVGTHLDSPKHFSQSGWTTDQIPLEKLVAPAAVVDITEKAEQDADYAVTVEDLTKWEQETGQTLNEVILLIRSGWEHRWNNRTAFTGTSKLNDTSSLHFPGLSAEAAQWLVDNRNIFGIGTEALSFDVGTSTTFMAHRTLLGKNIFGMENVDKVSELPLYGAMLYVMPQKIGGSSGAPARVMATFPEMTFRRGTRSVPESTLKEVIIFS